MNKEPLLLDFKSALSRFADVMLKPHASDLEKAGCIQYFEFCFELAWKSAKTVAEDLGIADCQSPKAALKCAFAQDWIDNEELWLDMLASRNRMSHTYEANDALNVYEKLGSYVSPLQQLSKNLDAVV
jgi:nucleotidyltransferase substrate binding protein (TIGR01987 family)